MSISLGKKFKLIRNELKLSQPKFADLVGIPFGSYKKYETDNTEVGSAAVLKVASHPECLKYALWLVTGTTNIDAGQIAPSDPVQEMESKQLPQEEFEKKMVETLAECLRLFGYLGWFEATAKMDFDDCGTIILKDIKPLIEDQFSAPQKVDKAKSA